MHGRKLLTTDPRMTTLYLTAMSGLGGWEGQGTASYSYLVPGTAFVWRRAYDMIVYLAKKSQNAI